MLYHFDQISAGPACTIKEWRDYFANEDYCERSDGVKMIWTKDCFKCYHKDGTLFTTRTEEGYVTAETDEFGKYFVLFFSVSYAIK